MKRFLYDGFVGETLGRSEERTVSGKNHFSLLKLLSDYKSLWQRNADAEQPLRLVWTWNNLSRRRSSCKKQARISAKAIVPSFERKDARLPSVWSFMVRRNMQLPTAA